MKKDIKIVIFDMDGVLVDIDSSWQFVHRLFHVDSSENLDKYLRGEIDYKEFMRRDIRLWGVIHIDQIKNILDKAPLMKGAKEVVHNLKKTGYKTAIISAGISILAERIQKELGINYTFANRLKVDENGVLTGEGEEIVNLLNKVTVLRRLALEERTTPRCCAIVGDSVFDIPLFKEAGLSIAFNATDEGVKEAADVVVEHKDLRKILPYFT